MSRCRQKKTKANSRTVRGKRSFALFVSLFVVLCLAAQTSDGIVGKLVQQGFENVGMTENDSVRVFVLQPTAYNVVPDGVKEAIRLIETEPFGTQKKNRIVVLENNVPQLSVSQSTIGGNWTSSKELGYNLSDINRIKKTNRSYGKVDLVLYPEFFFRNIRYSVMYEVLLNLCPTLEVSLWKGMKFTGQLVIPIVNDYGTFYEKVRPGMVTLSQSFRLPWRTNVTASVGFFSDFRHGASLFVEHYLPRNQWGQFWIDGRVDVTKAGRFDGWTYKYQHQPALVTGYAGVNYYWKQHNLQLSLRGHRFLRGEYGVRAEMVRHFRFVSMGIYGSKIEKKPMYAHDGFNAGFMFALNFPPRKSKRHGWIPRVEAGNMALRYNAGGDKRYGYYFVTAPDDDLWHKVNNNPEFIQSYIIN